MYLYHRFHIKDRITNLLGTLKAEPEVRPQPPAEYLPTNHEKCLDHSSIPNESLRQLNSRSTTSSI